MKLKQQNCNENRNLIFLEGGGGAGEVQVAFVFAAVVSVYKAKSSCRRNHKSSRRKNKQARKKDVKTGRKGESDYDLMVWRIDVRINPNNVNPLLPPPPPTSLK